ncbi:hypothetical protein CMI45_03645 [Candidatus Pacearchaeota archaeon]|nr:hypothetical protein [Candidatus Pacearchaeota archaeon]|tara:strand:- start:1029 stop:1358 length:330 start_codon:yes stop_codon:yes gene_type:complete
MVLKTEQFESQDGFESFLLRHEKKLNPIEILQHEYDHHYVALALGYNVVYQVDFDLRKDGSIHPIMYSIRFLNRIPGLRDLMTIALAPKCPGPRDLEMVEEARWELYPK